jgi:hypothetical protein
MGKKSRLKKLRRSVSATEGHSMWAGQEGIHTIGVGEGPSAGELAKLTAAYQARIRKSPLWDQMVKEFGERRASEMLAEFKVKAEET